MNARPVTASGVLLATGFLLVGLASPALAVCDAYSGNCPPPAGEGDGSLDGDGNGAGSGAGSGAGGTVSSGGKLPVTGGELVLLSTVGVGALVGGTALVLAGRRKAAGAPAHAAV